jgi:L-aminopeptidase/D-esterase-like protein
VKITACTTSGGSTYGLVIASGQDYVALVEKVCSSGNSDLLGAPVVTDSASFLAIGDSNFSFPADASASAIQKAVGGDIQTWGVLCG